MRTVLTMAVKDLKLISRDWLGLFFIIGFPILMSIFFGAMYGSIGPGTAMLSVALVDEDQSEMSARFMELLAETGQVQIHKLSRHTALDRVRRGNLAGLIAIPKGFGETVGILWKASPAIQVGVDPSRKAEAAMLEGMIMRSAGKLLVARFRDPDRTRPLIREAQEDIAASPDIPAHLRPTLLQLMNSADTMMSAWEEVREAEDFSSSGQVPGEPDFQLARIETLDVTRELAPGSTESLVRRLRSPWDISFPQAMLWGVMACAATFAATIVRERKQGTLLRLEVAPVTRAHIVVGKASACFLAVLGVIAMMVLVGAGLGMRPRSPTLLVVSALSVATCFVGIMMLMSVIGRTEEAVSGAAWGANMLMAMFGGAMVPLLFMPSFMKTIGHFSPVKWSILSLEGAIWRGFTWSEMLLPCGALVLTGGVCLVVGTLVLSRS
jgi:ABC-2 type transport system permease protein